MTWLGDRLASVTAIPAFHAALRDTGLIGADPRFMQLEMDISSRCNIRCVMCYHSLDEFTRSKAVFLSLDAFERVADSVLANTRTLTLSLGSEPMTSPFFIPILRIAARHQVPRLTFFTNGTLMNAAAIEAILDARVTEVSVSIDGATKETFEHIRRGANFEHVIGNVRSLVAARDARGWREPRIRFDVVMMQQNAHELPKIVRLAAATGATAINFFHMVSYDGLGTGSQSLRHEPDRSDIWLTEALVVARDLGIVVTAHPQLFSAGPSQPEGPSAAFGAVPYCHFPFFHVSMNSRGEILPCPFSHGEGPYGTVTGSTSVTEIWLGPLFAELRRRILDRDPPDMCRRCAFLASRFPGDPEFFQPRPH